MSCSTKCRVSKAICYKLSGSFFIILLSKACSGLEILTRDFESVNILGFSQRFGDGFRGGMNSVRATQRREVFCSWLCQKIYQRQSPVFRLLTALLVVSIGKKYFKNLHPGWLRLISKEKIIRNLHPSLFNFSACTTRYTQPRLVPDVSPRESSNDKT